MLKPTSSRVLLSHTLVQIVRRVFVAFLVLAFLTSVYSITRAGVSRVQAAAPTTLNFQARLLSSSGNLVPDGIYNIEFKLYNVDAGGSALWTETRLSSDPSNQQIVVKNGYMSAYLGDKTALPSNIWDQQLWLTMNIGGTGTASWDGEMTPRIRLTSVPFAFRATVADSAETLNKTTGGFTGTVDFATMTADRKFLFPDTSLATTASPGTICVYNGAASNCPAASGSAYYLQNDTVLQTQTNFHIQARNNGVNGTIGGVITGAASGQTVDLLQFRASDDTTVLAAVTAAGNLQVASTVDTRTATTLNVGTATATAVSIGKAGVTTTVNGALTVTEALSANGGATITGVTDINTTGTATTTIGNATAGIVLNGALTANEAATFNSSVTIAAQQTIRFVGGTTAQRPVGPNEGTLYFDTDTKQLLTYANGKWQGDRSTATKIVAASNSPQAVKDAADYVASGSSDQNTINAALTAAAGGKVYLAEGTFTISDSISIPNNTTLAGAGNGTLITIPNSFNTGITGITNATTGGNGTGVVIQDIRLDGNKANQSSGTMIGIYLDGAGSGSGASAIPGAKITNVSVRNWSSDGVVLDSSSNNTLTGNIIQGNDGNGFKLVSSSNNTFTNNTARGNSYVGFSLVSSSNNNTLTGNLSQENDGDGFQINSGSGNTLTGNTAQSSTADAGFRLISSSNNTLTGNTARDNTDSGFILDTSSNNTLTGNTAEGNLYGIYLYISPSNTVSGNNLHSNGGNNHNNAIYLDGADSNTITGNTITDTSATTSNYAINIYNNTSDTNYLANNTLGSGSINDLGTNTIYGGQTNASGNFIIQPAGTIELMKNTNITGDLNVTGNTDINGSLTVGNANQFVISNTGVVTSGTWNGASISDAYIDDNITISSSGSVDWTALQNYPAACSAGSAVTQLGDTITCTQFVTGTTASYIQNQSAGAQSSSDFWISGTGRTDGSFRADTSILTPTIDTATAAALNIGTTNATQINLNKNVVVAASQSLTITGGNTASRPGSPTEGMLYFDTTTKQLLIYANGKWQADRSTATKIVAASNSSQAVKDSADYVADGTADQTEINAALTAAAGGKVYLTEGTFTINDSISIPNNTTLAGSGNGTLITVPNGSSDIAAIVNSTDSGNGTGITIQDLRLDGNRAQASGSMAGIVLNGVGSGSTPGARITNVTSNNWLEEGVALISSANSTITSSSVSGGGYHGFGIYFSSNNTFSNNIALGNDRSGFSVYQSSGNTLIGNAAQGNNDNGFEVSYSSNNTLSGNTAQSNDSGFLLANSSNNTVTGNTAQQSTSSGFYLDAGSSNNTITGNTAQGGATTGIFVYSSSNHNTITGNTLRENNGTGLFISSSSYNTVSGNNLHDNGANGTNNAIFLADADSNTITNNTITDTSATSTNYAINISNNTSDNNYLADNTLGGGSINDLGTNTIYGGQTNASGNFIIQPAGTIELMKNTNITGDLHASGNADFDGSLTVGNANQFVISNTGVVTAGTWQGTAIADTYVADNLTINSSGTVDWQALSNYPAACTTGQAITQLGDTVTCSGFVSGSASDYIQNQNASQQTSANYWISGTARSDTSVLTPTLDAATVTGLNIGTTNANAISISKSGVTTTVNGALTVTQVSRLNGNVGINIGSNTPTGDLTFGDGANRTINVLARTSAGAGYNLTVVAGNANGSNNAGGGLVLQGGAAVAGNANGGSVTIAGGAGSGTGTQGLVNLSSTAFSTASVQTISTTGVQAITAGNQNLYSTLPITASVAGVIATLGDPSQSVIGRILYVTARSGSQDFTLRLNSSRTPIDITMKANSTATLIWNGTDWTAAGASSSTDLQAAYNNTIASAGGAELVLNAPGGNADGFTIRNNPTTPISGGILEVQSGIGTNLFSVNNFGTELANNGGAETAGGTSTTFPANTWTAGPVSATISRTITAGQYVTGQAGVSVATTNTANSGVRNNLSGNPVNTIGARYQVSFTAKSSINGTNIDVQYSRNGGTNVINCIDYGAAGAQTLSNTIWTKITCTIVIDSATAATDPDLFIRKTGAGTPTIYIDNLSFIRNDSTTEPSNVQIGGGINGGQVTLFTLDRSSSPPVANGNETYLGSMYYDTTTGRIQCYESDGWGACGSAPDNIITLTPEYSGAVLNGGGVGVMTADFCANQAGVLVVGSLCSAGEARNFYQWTSPQATLQTYSIYVTYKLPETYKEFADSNTMRLTAYRDDASDSNALVTIETYRKNVGSGTIAQCGSTTNVTQSSGTWEQRSVTGDENTCGFTGGDYIIFKITMSARSNKNVYVENLNFTYMNQ